MGKTVKLVMVTSENNNKFYEMTENSDGTFLAEWGRVGASSQKQTYPIYQWDKKYNEKVRKGYKDITEICKIKKPDKSFKDIELKDIKEIIDTLQRYAKVAIKENYTVSSEGVTQKQIELAQNIINDLVILSKKRKDIITEFNDILLQLFTTIPRKMEHVKNYLINEKKDINTTIQREQELLDVMEGQVVQNDITDENTQDKTFLDIMGLKIDLTTREDEKIIKEKLKGIAATFNRGYQVINIKTQKAFDDKIEVSEYKDTDLLWHGSRNENWWNIISLGLLIKPSNAIHTGSMFGPGIYFANKAQKSLGYTSHRGSYWAKGSANEAFLALYNVHLGKPYHINKHQSWHYTIDNKTMEEKQHDCVFAHGGADLRNDEIIVYNSNQCTIKYLVRVR